MSLLLKNKLSFIQGNIIKYVCRFDKKNGNEDIDKIIHYCELGKEDKIMWLNLLSLDKKTGAKIYQNKQKTEKQLMSDIQSHAEQMAKEVEYKAKELKYKIKVGKMKIDVLV